MKNRWRHYELTSGHVLSSAYVIILWAVARNAVNKSVWRKKDRSWLPLNKHAMHIWLSSLRIIAHLSWRTEKHLHVLHMLRITPRAPIPNGRMAQFMQPWVRFHFFVLLLAPPDLVHLSVKLGARLSTGTEVCPIFTIAQLFVKFYQRNKIVTVFLENRAAPVLSMA